MRKTREFGAYPYEELARAKAQLCLRSGHSASDVLNNAPWLFEAGDTHIAGGVFENGLVVAVSGLAEHLDEMIAWWILSTIQGLCRNAISNIPDSLDFLK